MSRLESLKISGGEWISTESVFHVNHPHTLTQAAGYLKYYFKQDGPVYLAPKTLQESEDANMHSIVY